MTTFFTSKAKSVSNIRFHIEELSISKLFCIVKKKGWTLSSLIRTSSRIRNDGESVKRKMSNIGRAQRYVISERPTLGVNCYSNLRLDKFWFDLSRPSDIKPTHLHGNHSNVIWIKVIKSYKGNLVLSSDSFLIFVSCVSLAWGVTSYRDKWWWYRIMWCRAEGCF